MDKELSKPSDLAKHVLEKLMHSKLTFPLPALTVLEDLFECLFYTSMRTEESEHIKVTVTLIDPVNPDPNPPSKIVSERWSYIQFDSPIPLNPKSLAKLSKAADPSSSSLAVYYNDKGELFLWGMIDQAMHYQSFLNYESESGSEQPGLFQVFINDIGTLNVLFDYELLATLKQNMLVKRYLDVFTIGPVSKILKKNADFLKSDLRVYLKYNYPEESFSEWEIFMDGLWIQTLSRILLKIQNYRHGGAILISDDENDIDIKYRINYERLTSAMSRYAQESVRSFSLESQITDHIDSGKRMISGKWYTAEADSLTVKGELADEIKGCVSFLASQTCVDGVVLFNHNMVAKGFGGVLKAKKMPKKIYVATTSTATAKSLIASDPVHYGTRHRSMIAYCWNHPTSLGLVVSQDGEIRAFARIEDKLIMWENIKMQQYLKSRKLTKRFGA